MAARGTGLPGAPAAEPTPMVDFSGAAQPYVSLAHEASAAAANVGQASDALANSIGAHQAEANATEQDFHRRPFWVPGSDGYNRAIRTAQTSTMALAVDGEIEAARLRNLYNPDGFKAEAKAIREAALKSANRDILFDVSNAIDRSTALASRHIAAAVAEKQYEEARQGAEARLTSLEGRISDHLRSGNGGLAGLTDPTVAGDIKEYTRLLDEARDNPAWGVSPEQHDAALEAATAKFKAAAVTGQALNILRTQGEDAYLSFMQHVRGAEQVDPNAPPPPPGAPEAPVDPNEAALAGLTPTERDLAYTTALQAGNAEMALNQQRENVARQNRSQAEQDMVRAMQDDAASYALYGHGTGTLDADKVEAVMGPSGRRDYLKALADAAEDYRQYGDIGNMPDDQALARVAEVNARERRFGATAVIDASTPEGFEALRAAQIGQESGGRQFDGRGRTLTSTAGALGVSQMMPDTARAAAARLGIPFDMGRLRNDRAYNDKLGREELRFLLERYDGNSVLALAAYNAGPGAVDKWVQRIGDPRAGEVTNEEFASRIPFPETRDYVAKISGRMTGGRGARALDAYNQSRQQRAEDPASIGLNQFPVQAANAAWHAELRAGRDGGRQGAALVRAYRDAQTRAGIPPGQQQPLPNAALAPYVKDVRAIMLAHDQAAFQKYYEDLVRHYNDPGSARASAGDEVWQAVLERVGMDAMSARVSTRILGLNPVGQQEARAAVRTNAQTAAARGTTPPTAAAKPASEMTDAEIRAQLAGLGG